ncbi:hypothetical protein BH23ACT2_BH23ACT2_05670 [soil metagenome]
MVDSTWEERVRVLNQAGYARYDESTARTLGDTATLLLDRWDGDLRRLREEARRDPGVERRLLKEAKGMGDVGASMFLREVQAAWPEVAPMLDGKVIKGARALGLGSDPGRIARLVPAARLPALSAALVRVDLEGTAEEVIAAADRS